MKLKKIRLTQLNKAELEAKEMSQLFGGAAGCACGCSCAYANSGGSSTTVNMCANSQTGSTSPTGTNTNWVSYGVQQSWNTPTSGWGTATVYGASPEGNNTFYWSCTTSCNGGGYGYSHDGSCPF